jgi:hypothetical protein
MSALMKTPFLIHKLWRMTTNGVVRYNLYIYIIVLDPFNLNDVGKLNFLCWNDVNKEECKHIQVEKYLDEKTHILYVIFCEENFIEPSAKKCHNNYLHPTYILEN